MLKQFAQIKVWNHNIFQNRVNELEEVLDNLCLKTIPSNEYTLTDLKHFCISVLDSQQQELRADSNHYSIAAGSWSVTANINDMDSDCRFDYIMIPTTIIISILTLTWLTYPELLKDIPGFEDRLRLGYVFACKRKFEGVGLDYNAGLYQSLDILNKGRVLGFIKNNPDFCPAFYLALIQICDKRDVDLKLHDVGSGFGDDNFYRVCNGGNKC